MVEFGLILPIFLTFVFGIIESGQLVWMYNSVSEAAREGARYAATHGSTSATPATSTTVTSQVKSALGWLDPTKVTVNTTWTPDNKVGSVVQVQVKYTFVPTMPLVPIHSLAFASTSKLTISY
jgi:Flp pilus assembly protein TadG